jgi:8-oxo-dGTP pyrophosphatase MutT (NUDIX family)
MEAADTRGRQILDAMAKGFATDPPVSESQRRLMWAAASGKSKLGVPQSVGKEFANADPGGKLPERAKDMERSEWRGGLRWLLKYFVEEMDEPEHREEPEHQKQDPTHDDETKERNAAALMFLTKDGQALFLKRAGAGDHAGEWAFPGGNAEGCETPLECALREIAEETGYDCRGREDDIAAVDHSESDAGQYVTFAHMVDEPFAPKLNDEHSEHVWRPIDDPPKPTHPGVKATLDKVRKAADLAPRKATADPSEPVVSEEAARRAADAMLAMDRAPSARSYDDVGRLHVDQSNISKATVNPYFGKEIPDFEKLGLDPEKKYQLLRHPDEIAKAAHTFNNLPILIQHVPVSAEDYQPDLVVGSTGTDAEFSAPYLTNSLVIWAQPAIDEIENGNMRQLSCAYSYTCDLTPGTYEGTDYAGVMRDLVANHVSLVKEGRAGPDVMVADAAITEWESIAESIGLIA